ncbi:hypothetical protein [uncultured Eubacterium sp.]|jgi:hypothetical protein|uniref:hypothetical protein n=1 Tax=uncultured Eubacterium sp. TaxID=165185 RepID=UPI0025925650|nr:hypothetical protein [uncultured Eubacterium sp.]
MKERVHITTIDNPFNPFEDFASWYDFDMEKGYCSCQRVARLANITDDMSEVEKDVETERATRRLVEIDPLDIYQLYIIKVEDDD